jgi:hypothetical protein
MGEVLSFPPVTYAGRILALNPEKATKFQCRGFVLGPWCPYAVVSPESAESPALMRAVADGRLIDITDCQITGIKTQSFTLSPVRELEGEEKIVYFVPKKFDDGHIERIMVVPKDAEQAADFARQMKETGTIEIDDLPKKEIEKPTGLTPISIIELKEG